VLLGREPRAARCVAIRTESRRARSTMPPSYIGRRSHQKRTGDINGLWAQARPPADL
jgi:hypothetical protein